MLPIRPLFHAAGQPEFAQGKPLSALGFPRLGNNLYRAEDCHGLGIAAFEWISPIGALHRGVVFGMGMGWTSVAAVFLFDVFVVKNGFCGHLCPLGAFYSLAGTGSMVTVIHRRDRCTSCMRCIES